MMKSYTFITCIFFFSSVFAQDTLFYDSFNPKNDNIVGDSTFTFTPLNGKVYSLVVDGTYSGWPNSFYTSPCGPVEYPAYPSPNVPGSAGHLTNFDMEHAFSYPTASLCNSIGVPNITPRMQISLDNGLNWFHPITSDTINSNHLYNYEITGQGNPIRIRQDSRQTSDDHGQLRFIFTEKTPIGIATHEAIGIHVYPNPVANELHITSGEIGIRKVKLYKLNGQVMKELNPELKSHARLQLSELLEGLYFLESSFEDGSIWVERIIVKH